MIILLLYHLKYHRRIFIQYWKQILLWYFWSCGRRMIIDCQLKSLLKNYLENLIVGFGQADVLGLRFNCGHIKWIWMVLSKSIKITEEPKCTSMTKKRFKKLKSFFVMKNKKLSVIFPILILHCFFFCPSNCEK